MNQNLYIKWSLETELGISIIDEQHRGIVSAINTLYYFSSQGKGYDALLPTIKIVEQYSVLHFELEEEIMMKANYPHYDKHCLLHKEFIDKTMTVKNQSAMYKDPRIVLNFLRDWYLHHIKVEDHEYVLWLNR